MKFVILAGGSGTRLWPLSREYFPKQFIRFPGRQTSLFQDTVRRCLETTEPENILVVAGLNHCFLIRSDLEEMGPGAEGVRILGEPCSRNTLPALWAALRETPWGRGEVLVVLPSDHWIRGDEEFYENLRAATRIAHSRLVIFGIRPDRPHTGYGYIAPGKPLETGFEVESFREKPDEKKATEYIERGFLWNSGMLVAGTDLLVEETREHAPEIHNAFREENTLEEAYGELKKGLSIDYGILEKSGNVAVIPADFQWDDLGSFDALKKMYPDGWGCSRSEGRLLQMDGQNNLVLSETGRKIVLLGQTGQVVVDTGDCLLVCPADRAQMVGQVPEALRNSPENELEERIRDRRPWGEYTVLEAESGTEHAHKVKRIRVRPGKRISYQKHRYRSEHWVVLSGTARVTIGEDTSDVAAGESVFVRPGQLHRLENPGPGFLEIIEVQMGSRVDEEDIVRFDDDFGRPCSGRDEL